jgi:polar amino acid transport system substrate-binding protein
MKHLYSVTSLVVLASLVLAACATPPAPVTVLETVVVTAVPTAGPTEAPAPTAVAQVPADQLTQAGKLLICTDFPYPPQEFFDEQGNPAGVDVEIGTEIAKRLGLQVQFVNSVFDTIIAAVTSGKCNIIISAQNITTDRKKQVSMIPYFQAGQSMVAAKGNPQNISAPTDLCGKSAAAESGTTESDYLQSAGDYKASGGGLTVACAKAGKPPVNVVLTQKDTDALQQLQAGKVAVYFADSPVAAYYTVQHPDQFQLVGQVIEPTMEGISVPCGAADCTSAPLSPLGVAVQTALKSMMADGTYAGILKKWNLSDSAVTP